MSRSVVVLVGSLSRSGGGVFESLVGLSAVLARIADCRVYWLSVQDANSHVDSDRLRCGEAVFVSRLFGLINVIGIFSKIFSLRPAVLHLHGVWSLFDLAALLGVLFVPRVRLVISPHGMLDDWIIARRPRLRRVYISWLLRPLFKRAAIVHCLSAVESASVKRLFGELPCVILGNAVPSPAVRLSFEDLFDRHRYGRGERTFLYLGRLDIKKNVLSLVEAWRSLSAELRSKSSLAICGWGDELYIDQIRRACGDESIAILPPCFGEEKFGLMRSADFIVLPSFSEGLPLVPIEAWACERLTLLSSECNFAGPEFDAFVINCGTTVNTIRSALESVFHITSEEYRKLASRGRDYYDMNFSADACSSGWLAIYGLDKPLVVSHGERQ